MDDYSADIGLKGGSDSTNYVFSGKVMLATVIILSVVCVIVAFFHIYSRWYLARRSTAALQYPLHQHAAATTTVETTQLGLDAALLKSLPTFTYSITPTAAPLDCAICLSEFEEFETGRILPKCNHCFHLECIDMWFHSHTNCPLCRSPVQSISDRSQLVGSSIDETADVLAVIVEVPVTTEREADYMPESEGGYRFKPMVGPTRSLRRFLSI